MAHHIWSLIFFPFSSTVLILKSIPGNRETEKHRQIFTDWHHMESMVQSMLHCSGEDIMSCFQFLGVKLLFLPFFALVSEKIVCFSVFQLASHKCCVPRNNKLNILGHSVFMTSHGVERWMISNQQINQDGGFKAYLRCKMWHSVET